MSSNEAWEYLKTVYNHEQARRDTYEAEARRISGSSGIAYCNSLPTTAGYPLTDEEKIREAKGRVRNVDWQDPMIEKMRLLKRMQGEDYTDMGLNEQRVGTAERDRYIDHLTNMYAEGFLDNDEFTSRMAGASTAKTYGYLRKLIEDLPAIPAAPAVKAREPLLKAMGPPFLLGIMFVLAVVGIACLAWVL